jgi:hypothetical protein
MCEDFHYKNDYKLNILKSFYNDHIVKHLSNYEQCYKGDTFERLPSIEDKDRAFLDCHGRWIRNLRGNVSQELEIRVRDLLQ